jgi:hypothetical protein
MFNKPLIGVAAAVLLIAVGGFFYMRAHRPLEEPVMATPPPADAAASAAEDVIQHPLPSAEEAASSVPLPELGASDSDVRDALSQLLGSQAVMSFLKNENIVRNLVVTIDNLPRQKLALDKRPTTPIAGSFKASGDELHASLDAQNYERYKPMVAVIDKLDMRKLARVYIHWYPLLQQAYQNLGYPNGYFNDRLVQVIDSLLATPQPTGPLELVRPNVMYTFADPALEALPSGQKLLLRMGPDNAAIVKNKLRELRTLVTAAPPKH